MAQNLKINILAKDKTKQAFQGIRGKLAGLKNAVMSVQGALVGIGAGLVIKSFVDTGRQVEDLQVRLKQLFGSTQEGARAFDVMAKFAGKVPFSLESIQQASGNLAVVAGDADRLAKILEITGNVASVTGLDFATTAEQIQRSFAGGIASADIFRERGVRDLLGFSAGATVSAEETVKAFEKVFGKNGKFGTATDELATTFTGTLSMLGDKLFNFKRNVANAEFFDTLKAEFKSLDKFIADNAQAFEDIARVIGKVLTGAVKLFSLAIKGVASAVGVLRSAFEGFIGLLNKLPYVEIQIMTKEQKDALRAIEAHDKHMMNIQKSTKGTLKSLVNQKTTLEQVVEEIAKSNKSFSLSKEIVGEIKSGVSGVSKSIAESIVLGKELNESFKTLAQQILVNVIAKTIERIALKRVELVLDQLSDKIADMKAKREEKVTFQLRQQLALKSALNAKSAISTISSFLPFKLPFFNQGGAVRKGQPSIVGERGAELFIPNQTGQITQNARGLNGQAVNVNFTINAVDASGIDRLLVERRGTISRIINESVNERGVPSLI